MHYRRDYTVGASYFFTVVMFRRLPLLESPEAVPILRETIRAEKTRRAFHIDAIVILPDHIHAIWTLPTDDADYSIRWRNIKRSFTQDIQPTNRPAVFGSRRRKGEQAIWQRRFWEHRIRSESDLNCHLDYIHYNPVKQGLVMCPVDWQYSSIHRYIQQGILTPDWGVGSVVEIPNATGHELGCEKMQPNDAEIKLVAANLIRLFLYQVKKPLMLYSAYTKRWASNAL